MNSNIDAIRMCICLAALAFFGIAVPLIVFAPRIWRLLKAAASITRTTPVRTMLAMLAVGALVSYAGSKPQPDPTEYTVEFVLPSAYKPIDSMSCATGTVYALPAMEGYRWVSDKDPGKIYDGGVMFFDLAKPGETVRMTAVGK